MDNKDWQTQFDQEIAQASSARAEGNEGKARVCARRAAGAVIGEFLERHGISPAGPSAYDRLKSLLLLDDLSPEVREIAEHFLLRVTPAFSLPMDADLIAEAEWLKVNLLES